VSSTRPIASSTASRGALEVALARKLAQAQRAHRVRDNPGGRVVGEPGRGERSFQTVVVALPVAGVELGSRDPLRRVLRVEVEREPGYMGAEPVREPLSRWLAEPAKRSDVVRPDQNIKAAHSVPPSLASREPSDHPSSCDPADRAADG
jgi:hypothetical protein